MKTLDFAAMENVIGGGGCYNPCGCGLSIGIAVSLTLGCLLGIGAGVFVKL